MDIENCRSLFIGTRHKVFLDSACVGLVPINAREKILEFLNMAVNCEARDVSAHHVKMDDMKAKALWSAQKLFNATEKHVTLIESTTHGLNIAANSIPFEKDDEIIICDTEYLQVAIPYIKMAEKGRLKIIPLETPKNSIVRLQDFTRLLTKNTKAICLSSVQWCTGQRVFTRKLGELCRENKIWLIVDGVQEAGALNINVNNRYCDFYIAGGHKWLNAPYGCGIMYMSEKAIDLTPPSFGYRNLETPHLGWGKYFQDQGQTPFRNYNFPISARSFSIGGTSNYPGSIGLEQSINIILDIGIEKVEKRIMALNKLLKNSLREIAEVHGSNDEEAQSGITMFSVSNDPAKNISTLNHLLDRRILLSVRYTNGHGGIRASTHYYNNEEDIERLCREIKNLTHR